MESPEVIVIGAGVIGCTVAYELAKAGARVEGEDVLKAQNILTRSQPVDPAAREAAYRRDGWRSFDENAPLYTAEEIEEKIRQAVGIVGGMPQAAAEAADAD